MAFIVEKNVAIMSNQKDKYTIRKSINNHIIQTLLLTDLLLASNKKRYYKRHNFVRNYF